MAVSTAEFSVVLRSATAARNPLGPGGHVFLVQRSDIPYRPHVTVAAGAEWRWCQAVAADLNRRARAVRGRIEAIVLLEVGRDTVKAVGLVTEG